MKDTRMCALMLTFSARARLPIAALFPTLPAMPSRLWRACSLAWDIRLFAVFGFVVAYALATGSLIGRRGKTLDFRQEPWVYCGFLAFWVIMLVIVTVRLVASFRRRQQGTGTQS